MKRILLILSIILFIILLNFRLYIYNINYYQDEYEKLNIYDNIPKKQALENTISLFDYFKDDKPLTSFFNNKEKQHLADVKNIINKTIILFYISLVLLIVLLFLNRKNPFNSILLSGIFLVIIPILLSFLNFNSTFINFHLVFFNNNLWILNPETDKLIILFPQEFFLDFTKKIFTNSFFMGLILISFGYFLKSKQTSKVFSVFSKNKISPK